MIDEIHILPPSRRACKICAAKHGPEEPHDHRSLYYILHFYRKYKRFPTEEDAKANTMK